MIKIDRKTFLHYYKRNTFQINAVLFYSSNPFLSEVYIEVQVVWKVFSFFLIVILVCQACGGLLHMM